MLSVLSVLSRYVITRYVAIGQMNTSRLGRAIMMQVPEVIGDDLFTYMI